MPKLRKNKPAWSSTYCQGGFVVLILLAIYGGVSSVLYAAAYNPFTCWIAWLWPLILGLAIWGGYHLSCAIGWLLWKAECYFEEE